MMDTMTKSTELYTQAMGANGTMMEVQEKYMGTIEGKMGRLKATSQEFWSSFINSSVIKVGIDLLNGIVSSFNGFSDIFGGGTTVVLGFTALLSPLITKIGALIASEGALSVAQGVLNAVMSANPVLLVVAGITALLSVIGFAINRYESFADVMEKTNQAGQTFKDTMKGIDSNKELLNNWASVQSQLDKNVTSMEKRNELENEAKALEEQLGSSIEGVQNILESNVLTWEEKKKLIQNCNEEEKKGAIETLNSSLKSQKQYEEMNKQLEESVENYKTMKKEWSEALKSDPNGYEADQLRVVEKTIKDNYKALVEYNTIMEESGQYLTEFGRHHIDIDNDVKNFCMDLLDSGDAISSYGNNTKALEENLKAIPMIVGRTTEDIEALKKVFESANDIDFKIDISDIDLSYVSEEFIAIAQAVNTAHDALNKFINMYNQLGNSLDLMEEMKKDLEANGTFSDEMVDKILGSGNADLIALLDDEGMAYENLITLINEYIGKKEEAKQKAIETANAESEYQDKLEEKYEAEKKNIEEIMQLKSTLGETQLSEKGDIIDPSNSIKQLTKFTELANGVKAVIAEVNGQKVMITYDDTGAFDNMHNIKEVSEGVYYSLQQLDGKTVAVTIDKNGNKTVEELNILETTADGVSTALQEIDGKTYKVTIDSGQNILDMQELKKSGEELVKGLEVLNGKTYRVTIDTETGAEKLTQVTQRLDGFYEYVDASSGHPIRVVVDGDGVVIAQLDGVTGAIIDVEQWKQNLSGSSIKVTVDGTEQTVSNLGQISSGANGTYTAIGTLNGTPVRVTFNNKGEIVGDLTEVTGAAYGTKQAADDVNGNPLRPRVEGADSAVSEADRVSGAWSGLRSQAGTVTLKTVHENITRNIVENGVSYTTTGSRSGYATKFSIDSNEFAPVEATQDVVIHATPVVDTSEVEAFSAEASSGDSGGGGEGFSAPLPDEEIIQPFAVDSPVKDLRDATGNKTTYTMSSNTAEIISDTQALKKATNSLASSVKGLTQEIVKNNNATEDNYTNLEMTLDRYYKFNDVLEDYENALDAISDAKVHASDRELIDLNREEIATIQDKINVLKQLQNEQQNELSEARNILASNGFLIDSFGNLINSQEKLSELVGWANSTQNTANKEHVEYLKQIVDLYTELANKSIPDTINSIRDLQNEIQTKAVDEISDMRKKLLDALKEERTTQKEQEIGILDARIKDLQAEIDSLDDDGADLYDKRAKLEAELRKWKKDDSAYSAKKQQEIQADLDDLNKEIRKNELNKQIEEVEATKKGVEETYDKMLEERKLYEDANKLMVSDNQAEMLRLLETYGQDYTDIGALYGKNFTEAFLAEIRSASDALHYLKGEGNYYTTHPNNAPENSMNPAPRPTPTPAPTQNQAQNQKAVGKGSRVKVTDPGASIYVSSDSTRSSGTWKGAGVSVGDTLYVVNDNNGRVALARTNSINDAIGWIDKKKVQAFATGGYTGEFKGGRLAMLHEKEYILNATQTQAWLKLVPILTDLVKTPFLDMTKLVNGLANNTVDNSEVNITNNIEINNSSDVDMSKTNKGIEQLFKEQLRKYGKIKK